MSQTEANRESLSALLDDEANDMDIARVLKAVDDPELRADWVRQQQIRSVLRGDAPVATNVDVSAGVRAALEERAPRRRNPLVSVAVAASVTMAVVFGGQQYLGSQAPTPIGQLPGGVVAVQGASAMQASYGMGMQRNEAQPSRSPAVTRVRMAAPAPGNASDYERLARERYELLVTDHAAASAMLQPNAMVPYARIPETTR
jgi:sigma-E factor negative regulatory protein RseA